MYFSKQIRLGLSYGYFKPDSQYPSIEDICASSRLCVKSCLLKLTSFPGTVDNASSDELSGDALSHWIYSGLTKFQVDGHIWQCWHEVTESEKVAMFGVDGTRLLEDEWCTADSTHDYLMETHQNRFLMYNPYPPLLAVRYMNVTAAVQGNQRWLAEFIKRKTDRQTEFHHCFAMQCTLPHLQLLHQRDMYDTLCEELDFLSWDGALSSEFVQNKGIKPGWINEDGSCFFYYYEYLVLRLRALHFLSFPGSVERAKVEEYFPLPGTAEAKWLDDWSDSIFFFSASLYSLISKVELSLGCGVRSLTFLKAGLAWQKVTLKRQYLQADCATAVLASL